jgi:hypothetical protein
MVIPKKIHTSEIIFIYKEPPTWTVHHEINFEAITNLMHNCLYSYKTTIFYMFRALLFSS